MAISKPLPRRALALYSIGYQPATLKKAFIPTFPVDPLASLDIFGQQLISIQEPHLTEYSFVFFIPSKHSIKNARRQYIETKEFLTVSIDILNFLILLFISSIFNFFLHFS